MSHPARLHSGNATKSYTSVAADIDCITADPYNPKGARVERRPSQVIVWDSGNLIVEYDELATPTSDTIPVTGPYTLNISPRKIKSTGTVTKLTLVWN